MTDIKKIANPFITEKGNSYNCFGCSPSNAIGLELVFYYDGNEVFCNWEPHNNYEGYTNVVHGGIQATLMDEIASWYIYSLLDTAGVTKKLDVEYHKPLYISGGAVKITASLIEQKHDVAVIKTETINAKGVVCSSARVEYFLFPPLLARKKYNYPGREKFWL